MNKKYIQLQSSHCIGDLIPYSDKKLKEIEEGVKKYGSSNIEIHIIE